MDIRTAVWVSTAEKIFKMVLGETRNVSRKFRGVSAPALYKTPAIICVAPDQGSVNLASNLLAWQCLQILVVKKDVSSPCLRSQVNLVTRPKSPAMLSAPSHRIRNR